MEITTADVFTPWSLVVPAERVPGGTPLLKLEHAGEVMFKTFVVPGVFGDHAYERGKGVSHRALSASTALCKLPRAEWRGPVAARMGRLPCDAGGSVTPELVMERGGWDEPALLEEAALAAGIENLGFSDDGRRFIAVDAHAGLSRRRALARACKHLQFMCDQLERRMHKVDKPIGRPFDADNGPLCLP
jgi:hypothetical protein